MPQLRIGPLLPRLGIAILLAGCGDDGPPSAPEMGLPDLESSRKALVAALDAWKSGHRTSGALIGAKPAIGIIDAARGDRELLGYEIVGPLRPLGKARPFSVRLTLGGSGEPTEACYLVIGRDPIWVYRQEDFERMLHWEHKMDDEQAGTTAGSPVEDR